jgi:hypothetical protein
MARAFGGADAKRRANALMAVLVTAAGHKTPANRRAARQLAPARWGAVCPWQAAD